MTDEAPATTRRGWRRGDTALIAAGAVACAACCAGPLIALLAAIGLTSAVFAVAVPGFAVVAIAAAGIAWRMRRRSRIRCVPGTADLGMPTVRSGAPAAPDPAAGSNISRRAQPPTY